MTKKPYHNNPVSKTVKVFGNTYQYNPVEKTYTVPSGNK